MPRVSVFMPVYQQAAYVHEALESVLAQDYPNLEVVVGDDGSTDGTADIVREYAEQYPDIIVPLYAEQNSGVVANQNRILARCTGEYIAFFSGDDVWLPGKLHAQVAWFQSNPDATLCYTATETFDSSSGQLLSVQRAGASHGGPEGSAGSIFSARTPMNGVSVMVRRAACPPEGYDSRCGLQCEQPFMAHVAAQGRIGSVDAVFARYRIHDGNVSLRREDLLTDYLYTLGMLDSRYPEFTPDIAVRRGLVFWLNAGIQARYGDFRKADMYYRAALSQSFILRSDLPLLNVLIVRILLRFRALHYMPVATRSRDVVRGAISSIVQAMDARSRSR